MNKNSNNTVTEQEVQAVFDKIKYIVAEHLTCKRSMVTLDTRWKTLSADYLDLAYLAMEVEDLFPIIVNENQGWTPYNTIRETCISIAQSLNSRK